jgi:polysaccharide biosynthesis/export protein
MSGTDGSERMQGVHKVRAGMLGLVILAGFGCGAYPVPPDFQDGAIESTEYRIGAADVLDVRVWRNQELNVIVPVLPDGTISVPLAGAISAVGLTTGQLEDALAERLADYISTPEVSVSVEQPNSNRCSVVGEVQRAGWVPVNSNTRIMDALSTSGGFTAFANRKHIQIIRRSDNVRLRPGDVIVVPD